LVGILMAVDRINKSGGVNGRPIGSSSPTTDQSPTSTPPDQKLVVEDNIDAHVGGFLSNICLACMPVYERRKSST
jgi:ABC-type branched-subunit amino acid transport system substrate-binding protein